MKKFLLFAVVLLVSSMLVFAGGSKEPANLTPVLATGDWTTYNDRTSDGGSSISNLATKEEVIDGRTVNVHHVTGNVTTQFVYGFAGWGIDADEATMELYKTADALSFYIQGDGKRYTIKYKISTVEDYAYHEYTFETVAGEVQHIEVPMMFFSVGQPAWGVPIKFDQTLVTGVEWQTHESWRLNPRSNPFEVKMWDFMIHPSAGKKKAAAKAPAAKPGTFGKLTTVLVADNFQYGNGYQAQIKVADLMNGHKLTKGDVFVIKATYTVSRDLENPIFVGFADTTPSANYWKTLSYVQKGDEGPPVAFGPAAKAGEVVKIEAVITIERNASNAGAAANALYFETVGKGKKGAAGSGELKLFTMEFTEFSLTKK
ncbi:MAG: CIA30 family protein [Treponema sp.]|jgi:hypothetical protein|nr:CIA30 family protein [Treponema sp.]